MKHEVTRLTAVLAIASGLMTVSPAIADITITDFHNFTANELYASWSTPAATITSGPTTWEVSSYGYGSLWKYLGDTPINASGMAQVRLTLDITGDAGVVAGPIVDLVDSHGAWGTFAWYGLTAGSYVLTADLSTTPWLDISSLQHIHLECDPGGFNGKYDLVFKDLSIVPEPTSLALLALGASSWLITRRRTR